MEKQSSQQVPIQNKEVPVIGKQEEKKQKKEKKQNPPAAKKDQAPTPELFAAIDIRVGCIKECWKHPESQKLYCEKIQVFEEIRQIASGLQQFVPIEKMAGKCLVMANLKPRPLAGFQSNGMVVCASNQDHSAVELLIPDAQVNDRLVLQGHQQLFGKQKVALINPKKKILQRCMPLFTTDQQGFVVWNGIKVKIGGQYIKSTMSNAHVG